MVSTQGENLIFLVAPIGRPFNMRINLKSANIGAITDYKGLKFHFQYFNRQLPHLDDNILDTTYFFNPDTFAVARPSSTDEYQVIGNISYKKAFNKNNYFMARSTYQVWELDRVDAGRFLRYSSYGLYNELELHIKPHPRNENIIGLVYNHYNGYRWESKIANGRVLNKYDIAPDKIPTNDFAIYLNGNYSFKKALIFYYGMRYYSSIYKNIKRSNLSPRFALTYNPGKNLYFKFIYGRSFRVPTYFEKGSTIITIFGNPDLAPETSTSYDFVVSNIIKKFQWDVDFFFTTINNKIARLDATAEEKIKFGNPQITTVYHNVGTNYFYGMEINTKFRIKAEKLRGFAGYSYINAYNPDDDPATNNDDIWLFHHMFNLGLLYAPAKAFELTGACKVISRWETAPGYTLANFGFNLMPWKNTPFRFEFKCNNVLNTHAFVPEVSIRNVEYVPYLPKTMHRSYFFGISYSL